MNVLKLGGAIATLVVLAACVTVNIYFPSAQAEEAAERIVEDVLGKKKSQDEAEKSDSRGSALDRPLFQRVAGQALELLIAPAQAQSAQPDFNASSPTVRKIQASMKQRNSGLLPYYESGAVGFTNDGMVAIRDAAAIPLKERNKAQGLVSAENRDRSALYKAIAEANGHPEWEPEIRSTFARTWIGKAQKGWWYQNAGGQWVQK